MTFSKGCTRSAGSARSKKSSTQLCFLPTPRSPRVKYCTWMAARMLANGEYNDSHKTYRALWYRAAFCLRRYGLRCLTTLGSSRIKCRRRSEERRVGKGCRYRWTPEREKKHDA